MSLSVKNISYKYKTNKEETLQGISLDIHEGEVVTILGPNGCGKSTFIKSILGTLKANGKIFLDEDDLLKIEPKKRNELVGYLPQDEPLKTSLSVFEVIMLGSVCSIYIKPSKEQIENTSNIIKQFSLEQIANKKYCELSGGQRRIVNIAQIMSKNPKLLILDEPTANLDLLNELEVLDMIKQYTKKKNIITLLVLHSINMASRFSDELCIFKDGLIYKKGSPFEVINSKTIEECYGLKCEVNIGDKGYPSISILDSLQKKEYKF